jgi:predicted Zn-dependent peptidase
VKPTATRIDAVNRTVLPNGLRIVTEQIPHVRSVSVGVWVDAGSRHEAPEQGGISHFIEHMVFKGTETRSAEEIACSVDSIGGHLDAFTTKETVAFTAKVLDKHLPTALDVVSDLVLHPVFRDDDIEKEKGVVLEELKMDEDNPDYLLHEVFSQNFWSGHPMARPIIGSQQTITGFAREPLREFFQHTYNPSNLIVTAAGNLEHGPFVRQVEERFGPLAKQLARVSDAAPEARAAVVLHDKPSLEQVHLCLGLPTYAVTDPRRYGGFVLNTLLGGGVSSRLFLKIREREGLAYAVFSDLGLFSDAGCLSVYAGTSLEAVPRVLEHVMWEFRNLKDELVPDVELRRAKEHLKGSLMLSMESTSSRMSNLARQEKFFEEFLSLDEVAERIEAVTAQELREAANQWFHQDRIAAAVLGNLNGFRLERDALAC